MATQKALLLPVKQGAWQMGENTIPTPGPTDVVKILATGMNPIDWKIQTYGVWITEYPSLSGRREQIPEDVSFDQAASIPVGLGTVFNGIWNKHPQARSVGFPAPWEEGGETMFASKPVIISEAHLIQLGLSLCIALLG
ncbi:hypothetical protein C8Q80DRAFT_1274200 [Daedaleopsis nitida]|nr:hypothetical protein C8Q80DRAFT_1274200 [Daedaleopsis nitida]